MADHLGTVRDLAKQDGTIATHFKYDSFGNVTSGDTSKTRYLFTSREFDTATKLQYNRARYYDAAVGRWVSEDPLGFAAGDTNVGRYVGNTASDSVDPSGLQPPGWQKRPKFKPIRWPNDRPSPSLPNDGIPRDSGGLPTGLGSWPIADFVRYSLIPSSSSGSNAAIGVNYGCGGLAAMRAGLINPMELYKVPGAIGFGDLPGAIAHLGNLNGQGLIVGIERELPPQNPNPLIPGKTMLNPGQSVNAGQLEVGGCNFSSLLGTNDHWYWEDGSGSNLDGSMKVQHNALDRTRGGTRSVIYIVVPGTPHTSPMPPALLNAK